MPRNTRESNKRKLKAVIHLLDLIDEDLCEVYASFPDESRYKPYREAFVTAGQALSQFKDLIETIDGGI